MASTHYRPEIDGLRAVAVLVVVLFHAGLGLPGGYIGVDVFFVISGFLITGIIRRGLEHSTFSLAEFWERRVRRIYPALIVTVVATLAVGYQLLVPQELEELGKSSVAQSLLLANVYFSRDTGYFAGPAEFKPLLHTWSLAVEEQFYLLFPLLLVFFKTQSRKQLFWGMACIAIISFGGSIYETAFHPNAAFFLLPTRAWELLVGCMLSVLPWKCDTRPRLDSAMAMAGMLAILLPACCYGPTTVFPGLAAVPPVIGTAAVIYATGQTRETIIGRLLSLRPVVFIGFISYSLYLWHWPVIVYMRTYWGHLEWEHVALALIGSFIISVVSWRFIETPLRYKLFLPKRRRLFSSAFCLSGATALVGVLFIFAKGIPERFPENLDAHIADTRWIGDEHSVSYRDLQMEDLPNLGIDAAVSSGGNVDFLLWGDSHGMVLSSMFSEIAAELELKGKALLAHGQVPVPGVCRPEGRIESVDEIRVRNEVLDYIAASRPKNVILVCRWSWYTDGYSDLELHGNATFTRTEHLHTAGPYSAVTPLKNTALLAQGLETLVSCCEESGVTLWVVKQVPEVRGNDPAGDVFRWSVGRVERLPDRRVSREQHQLRQENANSIFRGISSATLRLVDPAPCFFGSDGFTLNVQDGRSNYRDNDHLTRWGVERLRRFIMDILLEIKQQNKGLVTGSGAENTSG